MLEIIRKRTENKIENVMPDCTHTLILLVPMPEKHMHKQKSRSTVKDSEEVNKEIQGTELLPPKGQVELFSWQGDALQ